jgi:hypothetical protein
MRILLGILILLLTLNSFSQKYGLVHQDSPCYNTDTDTTIYFITDTPADFRYGNDSTLKGRINRFLFSELIWPSQDDCVGTAYIQCIAEKDGSLSNFTLIRGFCKEFDNEAMRVVKIMPKWGPCKKGWKNCPVVCSNSG